MQAVLWLYQLKSKNASTADVGWSFGMVIIVGWYMVHLNGYWLREVIVFSLMLLWAIRLSYYLLDRTLKENKEDSRYTRFREKWGEKANTNFFLVYQLQPILNIVLSVPFLIIFSNTSTQISVIEYLAVGLWCVGLIGESLSDHQLNAFKKDPRNKGQLCDHGLWGYSRHPNFFFEWMMWVAYFVYALASPHGWVAIIAPACMLFLLLKVTGIPIIEKESLKRRGDVYRQYQKKTSMFIPLPKRPL